MRTQAQWKLSSGLGGVEAGAPSHPTRGRGLWKVAGPSFVVQYQPHPAEPYLYRGKRRTSTPRSGGWTWSGRRWR